MSLNFIDISSWQAGLKVSAMTTTKGIIIKATESTDYVNPYMAQWAKDVLASGKLLGFYHFAQPGDAIKQADFFLSKVKKYFGKAVIFLDWEGTAVQLGPEWAKTFMDRVYAKTGSKPMIYMSKSVTNAYDWKQVIKAGYGLWVAQYPNYEQTGWLKEPWTDSSRFGGWGTWDLFQYTSCGRVAGYSGNLDLDLYAYSKSEWEARARGSAVKQAVAKATTSESKTSKPKWKRFINKAVQLCKQDSHGYSQARRWPSQGTDFDCSSLVYYCADYAGYGVRMTDPRYTGTMIEDFEAAGFKLMRYSRSKLVPGDVLLSHNKDRKHTEIYIGDGLTAGAHIAETGGVDGRPGDQTGNEISVAPISWTPQWILRPPDSGQQEPTPQGVKYVLQRKCDIRTKRSVYSGKTVGSLKKYSTVYLKGIRTNAKGNSWGYIASGKYKGRYIAVKFGGEVRCSKAGTKTTDQLAQEVIAGHWGVGQARIDALRKKGYDAEAVQERVNQILS